MAYAIADTLAMDLTWDAQAGKLLGEKKRTLQFGDLAVPMTVSIVDSFVGGGKTTVLVKVMGNLMLMVTASMKRVRVYVLNAARYDGDANSILKDLSSISDHKRIATEIGKSLVRVYESQGMSKTKWSEIPVAA